MAPRIAHPERGGFATPSARATGPAVETLQRHRHGDHQEDQRSQLRAARDSVVAQDLGGMRGDRCRDDSARCQPGEKRLLSAVEATARGGDRHVERPHDEHEESDHGCPSPAETRNLGQTNVRGKQHEEQTEQQRRELLLELVQLARLSARQVPDQKAGDDGHQDAALVPQRIADLVETDDDGEGERVSSLRGHDPLVAHRESDEGAGHEAEQHTDRDSLCERPTAPRQKLRRVRDGELERDDGECRADRVSENGLAFENRRHPRQHANSAQDRLDDGGPGHHDERAEENRRWSFPAEKKMRCQRRSRRGHQDADGHQTPDRRRLMPHGSQVEGQSPLEEDDGHRERHQLRQSRRPERRGQQPAQAIGAHRHAEREQNDDARHAQVAREDLPDHAEQEGEADVEGRRRGDRQRHVTHDGTTTC